MGVYLNNTLEGKRERALQNFVTYLLENEETFIRRRGGGELEEHKPYFSAGIELYEGEDFRIDLGYNGDLDRYYVDTYNEDGELIPQFFEDLMEAIAHFYNEAGAFLPYATAELV